MCVNVTKVGQGHPKLLWRNASNKHGKVLNIKSKIRGDFHAYISKIVSRTKKVYGTRKHFWLFSYKVQCLD